MQNTVNDQDPLLQRNREIGAMIHQQRKLQRRTLTDCAAALRTSRRRFKDIEDGKVPITVVELEQLSALLGISVGIFSPQLFHVEQPTPTPVIVVEDQSGEIIIHIPKIHLKIRLEPELVRHREITAKK